MSPSRTARSPRCSRSADRGFGPRLDRTEACRLLPDRESPVALASESPAADRAAWEALAGDLDRLRSRTLDGVTIEPLYTAADSVADPGLPGFAPFVRGRTAAGTRAGWEVRQMVDHLGERVAVGELERGASGLFLNLRRAGVVD